MRFRSKSSLRNFHNPANVFSSTSVIRLPQSRSSLRLRRFLKKAGGIFWIWLPQRWRWVSCMRPDSNPGGRLWILHRPRCNSHSSLPNPANADSLYHVTYRVEVEWKFVNVDPGESCLREFVNRLPCDVQSLKHLICVRFELWNKVQILTPNFKQRRASTRWRSSIVPMMINGNVEGTSFTYYQFRFLLDFDVYRNIWF